MSGVMCLYRSACHNHESWSMIFQLPFACAKCLLDCRNMEADFWGICQSEPCPYRLVMHALCMLKFSFHNHFPWRQNFTSVGLFPGLLCGALCPFIMTSDLCCCLSLFGVNKSQVLGWMFVILWEYRCFHVGIIQFPLCAAKHCPFPPAAACSSALCGVFVMTGFPYARPLTQFESNWPTRSCSKHCSEDVLWLCLHS